MLHFLPVPHFCFLFSMIKDTAVKLLKSNLFCKDHRNGCHFVYRSGKGLYLFLAAIHRRKSGVGKKELILVQFDQLSFPTIYI